MEIHKYLTFPNHHKHHVYRATKLQTTDMDQDKNNKMSSKIADTAKQEVQHVRQVAEEGAKSGAYLYPFKVRKTQLPSQEETIRHLTADVNRASTTSPPTKTSTNH